MGLSLRFACRVGVVVAIVTLGSVVTGLLYNDVVTSEQSLAQEAFKGAFVVVVKGFETFMLSSVRAVCAIADAVATHSQPISVQDFAQVGRAGAGCAVQVPGRSNR